MMCTALFNNRYSQEDMNTKNRKYFCRKPLTELFMHMDPFQGESGWFEGAARCEDGSSAHHLLYNMLLAKLESSNVLWQKEMKSVVRAEELDNDKRNKR